jgi:hypothetical protein
VGFVGVADALVFFVGAADAWVFFAGDSVKTPRG